LSLAWMNSSISGWSQRRMPICEPRAVRTNRREVVTHATAAAHGFRGFHQRDIDAGLAVDHFGYGIAHRLHEAVDQRRGERRAGREVETQAQQCARRLVMFRDSQRFSM